VSNAFDAGSTHYKGKWERVGPWKSRLLWALLNGIERLVECRINHRCINSYYVEAQIKVPDGGGGGGGVMAIIA
jgi:hypothetical protein